MSESTQFHGFDHLDPTVPGNQVRARYARMRDACPVVHVPRYGGYGVITRYADVQTVALDCDRFTSGDGVFIPPSGLPRVPPLEFDGAAQGRWRRILRGALSPGAVKRAEPMIRAVVREHISALADAGSAELVGQFAEPVPAKVIGRLIGLSPERATEMRLVALAAFAVMGTDDMPKRMAAFADFMRREVDSRRADPTDDYISKLASGSLEGEHITDAEIPGVLAAFMLGGHHSTAAGLAALIHHVLTVPGLSERLTTNPDLIPAAVEESLRCSTPLQLFARTAAEHADVADQPINAGDRVMLNYHAANHDPRQYTAPEEFRLDRPERGHLAFGAGTHLCQGAALVRAEMRIAITELLHALPDLRVDGPVSESGLVGGTLMTLTELPVSFTPRSRS